MLQTQRLACLGGGGMCSTAATEQSPSTHACTAISSCPGIKLAEHAPSRVLRQVLLAVRLASTGLVLLRAGGTACCRTPLAAPGRALRALHAAEPASLPCTPCLACEVPRSVYVGQPAPRCSTGLGSGGDPQPVCGQERPRCRRSAQRSHFFPPSRIRSHALPAPTHPHASLGLLHPARQRGSEAPTGQRLPRGTALARRSAALPLLAAASERLQSEDMPARLVPSASVLPAGCQSRRRASSPLPHLPSPPAAQWDAQTPSRRPTGRGLWPWRAWARCWSGEASQPQPRSVAGG